MINLRANISGSPVDHLIYFSTLKFANFIKKTCVLFFTKKIVGFKMHKVHIKNMPLRLLIIYCLGI